MSPQKKSAQIGHRITENREQFGVRAVRPCNALPNVENIVIQIEVIVLATSLAFANRDRAGAMARDSAKNFSGSKSSMSCNEENGRAGKPSRGYRRLPEQQRNDAIFNT